MELRIVPYVVYSNVMDQRGFWQTLWEDDLRSASMDLVRQVFYLFVTVVLQIIGRLLDLVDVAAWLTDLILKVFDGLTVVALAQLAIPMSLRMIQSLRFKQKDNA